MSSPLGYTGFENPEEQYYGYSPSLPVLYTGAYQVRQFGVGGAATLGAGPSILPALANPTANMAEAATVSATAAAALYLQTTNDVANYGPKTT